MYIKLPVDNSQFSSPPQNSQTNEALGRVIVVTAMAMQAGLGFSKIIILVGAGYTSTLLLKNGKLSDLLGDIQSVVKGLEKKGESAEGDADYSEAIASQIRRLAAEVRQLGSARPIVINGNSGQIGNVTSLIVPAAAVGALGYGYMWWKGLSFSDLMYVTKRNMATAVSNLTKHLEHVSEALAATKRHLTQRIENLDGKLDEQVEMSKLIKNEVTDVRVDLSQIGYDLDTLQKMVSGLDGKICSLEDKQDLANKGVLYLCSFVNGGRGELPGIVQDQLKLSGKSRAYLPAAEIFPKGLKDLADALESGIANRSITDGTVEGTDRFEDRPILIRAASAKC